MTKGEYKVGVSFNPSANAKVDDIKRRAADLIDLIESIPSSGGLNPATMEQVSEVQRLKAIAQTKVEEAAMWAVKAATKGKRE